MCGGGRQDAFGMRWAHVRRYECSSGSYEFERSVVRHHSVFVLRPRELPTNISRVLWAATGLDSVEMSDDSRNCSSSPENRRDGNSFTSDTVRLS